MTDFYAELDALGRELTATDRLLSRLQGESSALVRQARESAAEAKSQATLAVTLEEACTVLSRYADSRQTEVRSRLEGLVTHGLRAVFEEDLALVLRTREVGKRTDTDLVIRSMHDGVEIETPILEARGGGVAAVTGFLLQVIMLLLHNAPRVLLLDESFAQVSAEYEPRLAEFISELAQESGVQIVMVTHSEAFSDVSDVIYRSSARNGITALERVK